jgi:hypothetical protein
MMTVLLPPMGRPPCYCQNRNERKVTESNDRQCLPKSQQLPPVMRNHGSLKRKKKKTTKRGKAEVSLPTTYTVQGVLDNWSDSTEYGISFRAVKDAEQLAEVCVLNKRAAKGMKRIIKNKLLVVHFKKN